GEELWVSNGTPAGTRSLTQLAPLWPFGTHAKDPPVIAAFGSRGYFAADDGVHGWGVWRSDGTVSGTHRVTDRRAPFLPDALRRPMTEVNGRLVFIASGSGRRAVWATGGDPGSMVLIKDCRYDCGSVAPAGGRAVFDVTGTAHGTELWSTDGTAGTHLLRS